MAKLDDSLARFQCSQFSFTDCLKLSVADSSYERMAKRPETSFRTLQNHSAIQQHSIANVMTALIAPSRLHGSDRLKFRK